MLPGPAINVEMSLAQTLERRGFAVSGACWNTLSGGRTNRSWWVTGETLSIVVKLFDPRGQNPMFPNDPVSEALALEHLAGLELAPVLLDHFGTASAVCIVYEYIKGKTWRAGAGSVAGLLKRVHAIEAPRQLRRAPDGSHAIEQQTKVILSQCPSHRAQAMWDLKPVGSIPPTGRSCLLHGDPVPGNIIGSGTDWHLIDWQCPSVGDPCEDLAIFLSPAMQLTYRGACLSKSEHRAFISAYGDHEITERYQRLAPWYHWRMAAYCTWIEARRDVSARAACDAEIASMPA